MRQTDYGKFVEKQNPEWYENEFKIPYERYLPQWAKQITKWYGLVMVLSLAFVVLSVLSIAFTSSNQEGSWLMLGFFLGLLVMHVELFIKCLLIKED